MMQFPSIPYQILQSVFDSYELNTARRKAYFMANCHHESGGFTSFEENLNYSVEGLLKTFARNRISKAQAELYGRTETRKANKQAIANAIYGGMFGRINLGNTEPNDGFKHRGMGAIQLTGKRNQSNYFLFKKMKFTPELLLTTEIAIDSAGWFWKMNNLNELADKDQGLLIRKKINGGVLGYQQVLKYYEFYLDYFTKNE